MEIKYSLIIPHHNNPNLLIRLLKTIPIRQELEVVIIDDGSDIAFQKALNSVEKDFPSFIFLYNKECRGGGYARNCGIKQARGENIIFADCDDFFLPSFDNLLNRYLNANEDIIFFNAISLDSDKYSEARRAKHLNRYIDIYSSKSNIGELYLKYLFGEPWCKIVKRELIFKNNIFFEEIPIHNDTLFSYMIGFYAKNITVDVTRGYCVTDSLNSISKSTPQNKLLIRARTFYKKNIFLHTNKIHILDRQYLSPYCELLKRGQIREIQQLNNELSITLYSFLKLSIKIISQEILSLFRR